MPSSLIIVALAAAWLVVLVPMVARRRQEVARPADSALSARVVRSGSARNERRKEFAMSESASGHHAHAEDEPFADTDDVENYAEDGYAEGEYDDVEYDDGYDDRYDDGGAPEAADAYDEPAPAHRPRPERIGGEREARPFRPGRGGFDQEAAEIAARAKYAYRQRVVVGLLAAALTTAIVAAVVLPILWWAHAVVDVTLVGYLVYLRRQVRIENEVRERRAARLGRSGAPQMRGAGEPPRYEEDFGDEGYGDEGYGDAGYGDAGYGDVYAEAADARDEPAPASMPRPQRKPRPEPIQHNGVYVDLDDEDPAFHELDQPGEQPFRKAVGQ